MEADRIDAATLAEATGSGSPLVDAASAKPESQMRKNLKRFLVGNRLNLLGVLIVGLFLFLAVFGELLAPHDPYKADITNSKLLAPSLTHPFGTDELGRDVLSRIMTGTRISVQVALIVLGFAVTFGTIIGLIAGYFGGWVDNVIMRMVDVVFTIPQVLLVLMFVNWRGPGITNIFLAIGIIGWVTEARLIRGQFLTLREQDYIKASRVAGAKPFYIIGRHLLPNSLTPIIVAATFGVPSAIFTEAAVSFAGVGIRPPQASWGQMVGIASQPQYIRTDPHMLLFPVLAIGLTMLGFTFLGDGLRDALDPKGND